MARSADRPRYSIAQAKDQLSSLIHKAEHGRTVELTRHGKPVAVIVSADEYTRLRQARPAFGEALSSFLDRWPPAGDGIDASFLRGARQTDFGREFTW